MTFIIIYRAVVTLFVIAVPPVKLNGIYLELIFFCASSFTVLDRMSLKTKF